MQSTAAAPALWPPDDTEESVLGTPYHQTTITNVRVGINEAAAAGWAGIRASRKRIVGRK